MPSLDRTKSLLPYKPTLESYEQEYRDASMDERSKVIDQICQEIMGEAKENDATVADEGDLQKECHISAL